MKRQHRRAGFTLVELLMVILIIATLIALLTVAVGSAMKRGRQASVRAEFSSINGALSSFQGVFGKFPPSQMILYENPADGNMTTTDPTPDWDNDPRNTALVRSIWPQFQFDVARDIDGDGTPGETHVLTGAECLAFFLGGVVGPDGVPIGFSKNPADPFNRTGTSREGPYLETLTNPSRLVDVDGDGFPEMVDPLPGQQAPIIYASANNGTGYNKHAGGHFPDVIVYTNDITNPTPQDMQFVYMTPSGSTPLNPKSHQLISPGPDGLYGLGGSYDPEGNYSWNSKRAPEADNLISVSP